LKETTEIQLQKQRELERSATMTESEVKQVKFANSQLQAELLSNVQLTSKKLALSKEMLSKSWAELKGLKSDSISCKRVYTPRRFGTWSTLSHMQVALKNILWILSKQLWKLQE